MDRQTTILEEKKHMKLELITVSRLALFAAQTNKLRQISFRLAVYILRKGHENEHPSSIHLANPLCMRVCLWCF